MTSLKSKQKMAGFGIVEVLIGAAVFLIVIIGLATALSASARGLERSLDQLKAVYLAEEGVEAVRMLRDHSWSMNIVPRLTETDYYLSLTAGAWSLNEVPESYIDNRFERRVRFDPVYRDGSGNISSSGNVDPNARLVTATVSWYSDQGTTSISLPTYLMKLVEN